MDTKNKDNIKLKLGLCLIKILDDKKLNDAENYKTIDSLRKLESASGVSFPIIQNITVGKRNPEFTTIIALLDGLNISLTEFSTFYDKLTDTEVLNYKSKLVNAKGERVKKKSNSKIN